MARNGMMKQHAGKFNPLSILGFVSNWMLLALAAASLACAGVGLSWLQHVCNEDGEKYLGNALCRRQYRYQWWNLALEAFALFCVFASLASNTARIHRAALIGLLAVATVLAMENTNLFFSIKDNFTLQGKAWDRIAIFLSGCAGIAGSNLLLILSLGVAEGRAAHMRRNAVDDDLAYAENGHGRKVGAQHFNQTPLAYDTTPAAYNQSATTVPTGASVV